MNIIQQKYKFKRIKNIYTQYIKNLDFELSKLDYDILIKKMPDKNFLNKIHIFMFRINRLLNPSEISIKKIFSRHFLTMYLIKYHLDKVLTTVHIEEKKILYNKCIYCIDFIKKGFHSKISVYIFGILFNIFCYDYSLLLEKDKTGLLSENYRHYSELKSVKKHIFESSKYPAEQKLDVIKHIENDIKETEKLVFLVDKKYDINYFYQLNIIERDIKNKLQKE